MSTGPPGGYVLSNEGGFLPTRSVAGRRRRSTLVGADLSIVLSYSSNVLVRRVPLNEVKEGERLGRTLLSSDGKVLLAAGQRLEERFLQRLKELGYFAVYIQDQATEDIEIEDVVSEQTRSELTLELVRTCQKLKVTEQTLNVGSLISLVDEVVSEVASKPNLLISFLDIRSQEDYLYAHSVNSCILGIQLATGFFTDVRRLKDLGVGLLLHDVGMVEMPRDVVNKAGKLTPSEKEKVNQHAKLGFEGLRRKDEISLLSAHIAYQHHERYDGTGYPRKLAGDQVHPYAKICAVVDAFDALVSDRPWRKRFTPDRALNLILLESGKAFDPLVIQKFRENVAIYPVGTMVRLSTHETAVVKSVQKGLSHRPVVRVIKDAQGREVPDPYEIDLMQERTILIEKVLS